jgi:RNA polymerase sigma-70 factor (ECF subfamily)
MSENTNRDEERNLLINAKKGEVEDFGKIVQIYQARLRAYAARFVYSNDDAIDMVQDAFIEAFQHLDRFDVDKDFGAWIRVICRNRIFNFYRSQKIRKTISLDVIDEAIQEMVEKRGDDGENTEERLQALKGCIEKLGTEQRELVEMRYQDQIPVKDIAEFQGKSATSLSMKLMRIRDQLRVCVERTLKG